MSPPFTLATLMFGTVNHFDDDQQLAVLAHVAARLAAHGVVVVSSWRPGRVHFSLYDRAAQATLESRAMDESTLCGLLHAADMSVERAVTTDWHVVVAARPARRRSSSAAVLSQVMETPSESKESSRPPMGVEAPG
jgi:hypothetical protein